MGDLAGGRPDRPENLVIIVDVANIRMYHRRIGRIRTASPTSLAHIDQCLLSLEETCPNAVVIKIADRALLDVVPADDRRELERRSELPFEDTDKIYLVPYADRPILDVANELEASVVSLDKFDDRELKALKTADVRYFRHRFNRRTETFDFPPRTGDYSLDRWWELEFNSVPRGWFTSEDYEELEWQLRSKVNDIVFPYTADRPTTRVVVPREVVVAATGGRPATGAAPPDRPTPPVYVAPAPAPKPRRLPVVFVDDRARLRGFHGKQARVVGRLYLNGAEAELGFLQGTPVVATTGVDVALEEQWLAVPAEVSVTGDVVNLRVLEGEQVRTLTFDEMMALRTRGLAKEPAGEGRPWTPISFTTNLGMLLRMRQRRNNPRPNTPFSVDGDDRPVKRTFQVFRDGTWITVAEVVTREQMRKIREESNKAYREWKKAQPNRPPALPPTSPPPPGPAKSWQKYKVFEHGEWNVVNRFVTDEVRRSEELESREKYEEWLEEEWLEEGRRRRVRQLLIAAIVVVVIVVVLLASAVSGNGQGAVAAFSAGTSTANGWWT